MAINNCFKCSLMVEKDPIQCIFCAKFFHGFDCVGLTTAQLKAIKEVKGIMWCCDSCQSTATTSGHLDFQKLVLNKLDAISNAEQSPNESVKADFNSRFDTLVEKITSIEKKFEQVLNEPELKRKATGLRPSTPTTPSGFAINWPKQKPRDAVSKVVRGTAGEDTVAPVQVIEELTYFHVSKFNPDADESVMKDWFIKILKTPDVECVKLTPKNIPKETLTFVSFKIGVKKSLTDTVMEPSVWPMNVMVKPFINRPYSPKNNFVGPPLLH